MCGRFSLDPDKLDTDIKLLFDKVYNAPGQPNIARGEIEPGNIVPVLINTDNGMAAVPMVWGIPGWDGPGIINEVKAENALANPLFRKPLLESRAIVVTTGFYQWQTAPGMKHSHKYIFREKDGDAAYLAGFFMCYEFSDDPIPEHFTILTTAANDSMLPYSERTPVLLRHEEFEPWLSGRALHPVLEREPFALQAEKVAEE